jgi:hypothetical protein
VNRPLIIGGGLLALYYFWPRKDDSEVSPGQRAAWANAKAYSGENKFPSIAGFHPAGATFSVWADPTDITAARAIKIAPIAEKQEWVRISGGTPYTPGYDPGDRIVPFAKASNKAVLQYTLGAIEDMLKVRDPFPSEDQASGGGAVGGIPLVITMGNLAGVPPELAVYEFDWNGVDPR